MFCKSSLYSVPYFQIPLHPDARSPASEEHRHPGVVTPDPDPGRDPDSTSIGFVLWMPAQRAAQVRHDESVKFAG